MNYNDLNTIINSNQKNIDKLTDYSLGFVSPLPHLAFEKAVKFAFEMFDLPFSPDLIKSTRTEIGSQQFDLIFFKRGLNSVTHMSHFDTIAKLCPIIYHVLKNGLNESFGAKASADKMFKIANTYLIDNAPCYPQLNQVPLEKFTFKNKMVNQNLNELLNKIHKEHAEIKFVFSPDYESKSENTQLTAFYTLSDEEIEKLATQKDFSQLKKLKSNIEKKELCHLTPIGRSVNDLEEKARI